MAADDLALGIPRSLELKVERVSIGSLRPNPRNARTHPRKQLKKLAESICKFGFNNPVLVDADRMILAGHGRIEAARLVGLTEVPVICLDHLTAAQKRAFLIGDNRIAEAAGWDRQTLALELQELVELLPNEGLDVSLTGFDTAEIDLLLRDMAESPSAPEDILPSLPTAGEAVTEAYYLCQLFRRPCQEALQRFSRPARLAVLSRTVP